MEALTVDCMVEGSTTCPSGGAVRLWRYLPRRDSWIGSPAIEVSHAENAELLLNPIQDALLLDQVQDVSYLTPLGAGPPVLLRTSDDGVHLDAAGEPVQHHEPRQHGGLLVRRPVGSLFRTR